MKKGLNFYYKRIRTTINFKYVVNFRKQHLGTLDSNKAINLN